MREMLQVRFNGGKKLEAQIRDTLIQTDQPVKEGGEGSAPQPFQLFLASIATCAGLYAINFCEARKIPTEGMSIGMSGELDREKKQFTKFALHLTLPEGFPEKYKDAVIRAMDQCFVKKHIVDPPEFELTAG